MADQTLAIHGGRAVFPDGPPAWPPRDGDVLAALQQAHADGSWGRYDGIHGERLTEQLCRRHGVAHAMLCASGTVAVELALRGLRVGAGDEVILAGYDFAGNFRAIESVGARPVLVDLAAGCWAPSLQQIEPALSARTKAIVVSHLHGCLAALDQIMPWARTHDVAVVEDACQVPGASLAGRPAGSWGDAGVHSFGGSKLLTAGRGGAVITDRGDVAQRIRVYCERGNHVCPLSELQAAVLLPQLEKLDDRNRRRQQAVRQLLDLLRNVANLTPSQSEQGGTPAAAGCPAYYKVPWRLSSSVDREWFIQAMRAEGVALDSGFRGFIRRSSRRCGRAGSLENAQSAVDCTVILHHPILLGGPDTIASVARAVKKVVQALATERDRSG